ncbi:MAG: class I SAM-dependent methyltransferase [Anaerolineales bacterium]
MAEDDFLSGISLFAATYFMQVEAVVNLTILNQDGKEPTRLLRYETVRFEDNRWHRFDFDPIADSKGRGYWFCIEVDTGGNPITFWTNSLASGSYLKDGIRIDGVVCFDSHYGRTGGTGAGPVEAPREKGSSRIDHQSLVPQMGLDLEPYIHSGDISAVHHIIRYRWAAEALSENSSFTTIIDAGCGAGYGTYLLASANSFVSFIGVDIDPDAIRHARNSFDLANLEYRVGSLIDWDADVGSAIFDCVVCFDTIEHIEHREILMESIVNHLHAEGMLLLSTPCGSPVNILHPEWESHRIEYSTASLYDLLSRYFKRILRPDGPDFPHLNVFDQLNGTPMDYLLKLNPVVCMDPIKMANPYK